MKQPLSIASKEGSSERGPPHDSITSELLAFVKYILLVGRFLWAPFVYVSTDFTPLGLFQSLKGIMTMLMLVSGAVIADATAVGGGIIVFNPVLQLIFGASGHSALVLSITAQRAGMTSGTYAWYKKGEFSRVKNLKEISKAHASSNKPVCAKERSA